ncbi:hypothetical protein N657DRAFT_685425 [Parathielavia appendiculata]|uniref:Uncharacterized protein n=1 Tax=Parathielavia appendiculata TaxID=2587402 RepID=A0AAN6YYE2_9PEZI|nr:hypothetical protein N657DRAFT_685425 [Parathielavia appendiculata]
MSDRNQNDNESGPQGPPNSPANHQNDATDKPKGDSDMVALEGNPPPGSASGDGGDNRVGQDHFMKEILEEDD